MLVALIGAMSSFQASAETVSGVVHIGDLSLSTLAGRATLEHRIKRMARRICSVEGDPSLEAIAQSSKCREIAIASARQQIASGDSEIVVASR